MQSSNFPKVLAKMSNAVSSCHPQLCLWLFNDAWLWQLFSANLSKHAALGSKRMGATADTVRGHTFRKGLLRHRKVRLQWTSRSDLPVAIAGIFGQRPSWGFFITLNKVTSYAGILNALVTITGAYSSQHAYQQMQKTCMLKLLTLRHVGNAQQTAHIFVTGRG